MRHSFSYPKPHSRSLEDHPRLPRVFTEATVAINEIRRSLGLSSFAFSTNRVEIVPPDVWPSVEKRFSQNDTLGLYAYSEKKCFIKNQIPTNFRHINQVEHGIRETGIVLVHELNHEGSEGGLYSMFLLDEGITERNTIDIFNGKVRGVLSGEIRFSGDTEGRPIWDSIVQSADPAAVRDILLAYWMGSDLEGIQAVRNAFGRKAMALLKRKDLTKQEWDNMLAG